MSGRDFFGEPEERVLRIKDQSVEKSSSLRKSMGCLFL